MKEEIDRIRRNHGLELDTTDVQALRAVESLKTNLNNSLRKYATLTHYTDYRQN